MARLPFATDWVRFAEMGVGLFADRSHFCETKPMLPTALLGPSPARGAIRAHGSLCESDGTRYNRIYF
jgi:hypothetical protein